MNHNNHKKDSSSNGGSDFIPSATWQGPKPGFYFGTSSSEYGTGYYRDSNHKDNDDPDAKRMAPPARKRAKLDDDPLLSSSLSSSRSTKRRVVQIAEDRNETKLILHRHDDEDDDKSRAARLLQQAEEQAALNNQQGSSSSRIILDLTPRGIRAATANLNRIWQTNELQRAEYPDEPERYMDSELNLFEHIRSLKAIATGSVSQLYPLLLSQGENDDEDADSGWSLLSILTQLLLHDNTDIVTSVIAVWLEWLDVSLLVPEEEETENVNDQGDIEPALVQLAARMLQPGGAVEMLVELLPRLSSEREYSDDNDDNPRSGGGDDDVGKGAEDILSILENLLEMDMQVQQYQQLRNQEKDDSKINQNTKQSSTSLQLLTDGSSVAATLCRATNLVAWLFQQMEMNLSLLPQSASSSASLKNRCLELLSVLAPREDVHVALPDWSRIPIRSPAVIVNDDDDDDDNKTSNGDRNKADAASSTRDGQKQTASTLDGMEILMQQVALFRKKQPQDSDELDALENACLILDSALTFRATSVSAFLDHQGIELVVRCVKERVHAGGVCLKWLDFSGNDAVHRQACEHLVGQAGALKYLFPLLMGRLLPKAAMPNLNTTSTKKKNHSSASKRVKKEWAHMVQSTTIRILYSLTRHLRPDSPNDAKERLLAKFVSDHDKCDRIVELALAYDQKARFAEYKFYRSDLEERLERSNNANNDSDDDAVQLAALEAKLASGGDIFHRLCAIAAFCCVGSKRAHERILSRLHQNESGISLLRDGLQDFVAVLADGEQKRQLLSYLESI